MPSEAQPAIHADRRRPGLTLLVALLAAVPYGIGLVLPYYANGVHQRPADETIYAYDLGTMWPYDTALGGVVAFIAIVGVPTAPFISGGVAMWSLFTVWTWWRTLTVREIVLYAAAARSGSRRSPGWPRRWRTISSCGSGTERADRLYPTREGRRNPPYGVSRRSLVPCRRPDLPCTDLSIARLAGHN